jgi:hypothetical protein
MIEEFAFQADFIGLERFRIVRQRLGREERPGLIPPPLKPVENWA